MNTYGSIGVSGKLTVKKFTVEDKQRMVRRKVRAWKIKNFFQVRLWEIPTDIFIFMILPVLRFFGMGAMVCYGSLYLKKWDSDLRMEIDYGLAGRHLVVTAGKNYIASTFNNVAEPESMKFHAFGSGSTAAAAGDTTLQTEYTTEYNPNSTRPTGSQANATNTYTTVGTFTPDAAVTAQEWGLFSASSAGTLLDRQTYTSIGLNGTGDALQTTYVFTVS